MPEARPANHHFTCQVCGRNFRRSELVPASLIRPSLTATFAKAAPGWSADSFICLSDLSLFRQRYVEGLLAAELGEIAELKDRWSSASPGMKAWP